MSGEPAAPTASDAWGYFPSHWRSLDYFNLYRLTLATAFFFFSLTAAGSGLFGIEAVASFRTVALAYLILGALFVLAIRARWPAFPLQLSVHIGTDIAFVTILMGLGGGVKSGLGLMLLVSIASGALIGRGRLVFFYAALASLAVLLMQGNRVLQLQDGMDSFLQTALLSIGYFATAWLTHTLSRRAQASEDLALAQARSLERLNQVNALVARELSDAIVALDEQHHVFYANPVARELLGLEGLNNALPFEIARYVGDPPSAPGMRAPLRLKDRDWRAEVQRLPRGVVIRLEDQSRIEAAARQIKLAALGRLTASIAHEIRNPLAAILQAAELLQESLPADPAVAKLTGIIGKNSRRLDRLVQDVLMLNRRDRLHAENIKLGDFVAECLEEWERTEEIAAHAVITSMAENLSLRFDPQHLRQILWNLLRNAVRHGGGTPVRLNAAMAAGKVELSVEDDGPGVTAEHRARLFEPFFTTDAQGSGLGLYIARELAEANGARLDYQDKAGAGACFRLSVPC